jgi:YebC/PmpR family DNA-binding regulatory protein
MGRAFEYRKARKMKRWAGMAKTFTKIGREISMAVKDNGPDPDNNPRLRAAIQNSKAANMPKANVENAIKNASEKDAANYDEVVYEGYGPNGIAVLVETATDNTTRTVANVRHVFSKYGGSLGTQGSVDYMFERKGVFTVIKGENDIEELELELIDFGLEEITEEDGDLVLKCDFIDYGNLSTGIEKLKLEVKESSTERFPLHSKSLSDAETDEVIILLDKMEDDDDVLSVFHTMDMND